MEKKQENAEKMTKLKGRENTGMRSGRDGNEGRTGKGGREIFFSPGAHLWPQLVSCTGVNC